MGVVKIKGLDRLQKSLKENATLSDVVDYQINC